MQNDGKYYNQDIDIDENSTIHLTEGPFYTMSHFSLVAFKVLSLYLAFDSLITMCLRTDFFEFVWFGVCWTPWVCRLMVFTQFGEFLAIISSNILSVAFSPVLLEPPLCACGYTLWCSQFSGALFVFLYSSFLPLCLKRKNPIDLSSLLFLLSACLNLPLCLSGIIF